MRGSIFAFKPGKTVGHELRRDRYAVVVQSDLAALSTWVVCPTSTTDEAGEAPFRPQIELDGQPTRVLCEHVRSIDPQRLGAHVGFVSYDELQAIDTGLRVLLDLAD